MNLYSVYAFLLDSQCQGILKPTEFASVIGNIIMDPDYYVRPKLGSFEGPQRLAQY